MNFLICVHFKIEMCLKSEPVLSTVYFVYSLLDCILSLTSRVLKLIVVVLSIWNVNLTIPTQIYRVWETFTRDNSFVFKTGFYTDHRFSVPFVLLVWTSVFIWIWLLVLFPFQAFLLDWLWWFCKLNLFWILKF